MQTMNQRLKSGLILLLLFALIILSVTGIASRLIQEAGLKHIRQQNQEYLQSSLNRSLATFVVLSGIKSGLAIVEGSEVGLGFGIEVGDAVQSVYDFVDIAWRIVLASSAVLMGMQFLLHAAQLLEPWFLGISLILIFLYRLVTTLSQKRVRPFRPLYDLALLTVLVTIALYLVLPLSVLGGSFLSRAITAPSLEEADRNLKEMRKQLYPDAQTEHLNWFGRLQNTTEKLNQAKKFVLVKIHEMSLWMIKIMAGYLFDTVIFPLSLFLLLFHGTRIIARYLFDIQRQRAFHDDLDRLLTRHMKTGNDQ